MEPLQTLYEAPGHEASLPAELERAYGGGLELAEDCLAANFVASLDGVVALEGRRGSGGTLSQADVADRFLMGLLRSLADVIVVGAGTMRADGGQPWDAARLSPEHAAAYASLGRAPAVLAVVTAGGDVDPAEPGLDGGVLLTTDAGAAQLRGRLPASCRLVAGGESLGGAEIRAALRALGYRRLLTEGGPHLLGQFVRDSALDELFLTVAPVLAGAGGNRLSLLPGLALPAAGFAPARLLSVKNHGSHLFLRYGLNRSAPA
ncbi:MAG: dihydrofolate reductase family protein [Candidatus Dormibacteraeota bacterium]|nr:dihydrofolate reductase family protein [Candidatus Dormibacteraeota bacterium]